MNYLIPTVDNYDYYKYIHVAGNFVGFYQLEPTVNANITISKEDLYSGEYKISQGNVVMIDNQLYKINNRRVQQYSSWMFTPGSLVFFGLQHDHVYALDYYKASWYKSSSFNDLEGWFVNQSFNPVLGICVNEQTNSVSSCDLILFEWNNQIRNPNLDYDNAIVSDRINSIVNNIMYRVINSNYTKESNGDITVMFELNKSYNNQQVYIKPLINTPVYYNVSISNNVGSVKYNSKTIYGSTISFEVICNSISAGIVNVNII